MYRFINFIWFITNFFVKIIEFSNLTVNSGPTGREVLKAMYISGIERLQVKFLDSENAK